MVLEYGRSKKHSLQIPVRVVLNNKTFSAYAGFNYTDHKETFNIKLTKFYRSNNHKNCFELIENTKHQATFCDFGMESSNNFYNEWDYDYNLFKYQCYSKRETVRINQQHIEDELKHAEVKITYIGSNESRYIKKERN